MPRKPAARERLIEAFERIVVEDGERAATLDAVAARAGVSKGGLLYHFAARHDLAAASLERLRELARADVQQMAASEEGAARAFLRSSLWVGSALDVSILTASRLAQSGDDDARAQLLELEHAWHRILLGDLGDAAVAQAVLHMGDGLYHNAAVGILAEEEVQRTAVVEQLLEALERMRPER